MTEADDQDKSREEEEPSPVAQYTCPMDPEIIRDASDACPEYWMVLEPVTVGLEKDQQSPEYTFLGILLFPIIAAAVMNLSSVSLVGNALRLRRGKIAEVC